MNKMCRNPEKNTFTSRLKMNIPTGPNTADQFNFTQSVIR